MMSSISSGSEEHMSELQSHSHSYAVFCLRSEERDCEVRADAWMCDEDTLAREVERARECVRSEGRVREHDVAGQRRVTVLAAFFRMRALRRTLRMMQGDAVVD